MNRPKRPPPIACTPGTFAAFTVSQRLPKILAEVRATLVDGANDPRWKQLEDAVVHGGPIDVSQITASTPFWALRLKLLAGQSWGEQSFFDLELLFYRALDSLAQDIAPGCDMFESARHAALASALPQLARAAELAEPDQLEPALLRALAGNEADLSQLSRPTPGAGSSALLVDDMAELAGWLRAAPGGTLQVLADNAGSELCFDLLLVDTLLATFAERVVLQLKPRPMFVSDALIGDVEATLAGFTGAGGRLRRASDRLAGALVEGRLALEAPADWAEPRHMNALEAPLSAALRGARAVLVKGDLNYRRFFEDRAWPATCDVRHASVATGMRAFALRVLKSDCVVGIPEGRARVLSVEEPSWRSNGKHSMLQRVDDGAGG
jgi:hypothetical protein